MSHSLHSSRRGFLAAGTGCVATLAMSRSSFAESATRPRDNRDTLREIGRFSTETRNARRLCVTAEGHVLIVAGRKLLEFHDGRRLQETPLDRPARCVAAAADGRRAIGYHNRCEVFSGNNRKLAEILFPEGALLSDLAVAGDHLFAADAGRKVVWRCDLLTNEMTPITRNARFAAPAEFFKLAVSADGRRLSVANPGRHRIEQYALDGQFANAWGAKSRDLDGFGGCCNPVSFALLPDGSFITAERGQPRIKHFTSDGRLVSLILDADAFPESAAAANDDDGLGCSKGGFDLAVDNSGQLYILDCVTGDVRVLG